MKFIIFLCYLKYKFSDAQIAIAIIGVFNFKTATFPVRNYSLGEETDAQQWDINKLDHYFILLILFLYYLLFLFDDPYFYNIFLSVRALTISMKTLFLCVCVCLSLCMCSRLIQLLTFNRSWVKYLTIIIDLAPN